MHKLANRFHTQWKKCLRMKTSSETGHTESPPVPASDFTFAASKGQRPEPSCSDVLFATSGTTGIVDLGASQTVIGDQQVSELLARLPVKIRDQVTRTSCNLTFRFGNQQTLTCRHAILLPLGSVKFRIAIVPGKTPFLI